MKPLTRRCAIYTRKSSEEGLELEFNSLDAQFEACQAYILSQKAEGWVQFKSRYDDGGFSGGNLERPGLKQLLADIQAGKVDIVVVYKIDRLTRSLMDFAKLVEIFDKHGVTFVSVTQSFNTTTSMGRLTLNVLLSFAQFEREVTGERIRDKVAASKKKGMWTGGCAPVGYNIVEKKLVPDPETTQLVQKIFQRYLDLGCVSALKRDLDRSSITSRVWVSSTGVQHGGASFSRGILYKILRNPIYIGQVSHKGKTHPGQHQGIIEQDIWDEVQARLVNGSSRGRGKEMRSAAELLRGKIFDPDGRPYSPTYTKKGSLLYRYYISQNLLQCRDHPDGYLARLPAKELEEAVLAALHSVFDCNTLAEIFDCPVHDPYVLHITENKSGFLDPEVALACLSKVTLAPKSLQLTVSTSELATIIGQKLKLSMPQPVAMQHTIVWPFTISKPNGRTLVLKPSTAPNHHDPFDRPNEANSAAALNERQRLILNKLLDGFDGNLTTTKWAKITNVKRGPDIRLALEVSLIVARRYTKAFGKPPGIASTGTRGDGSANLTPYQRVCAVISETKKIKGIGEGTQKQSRKLLAENALSPWPFFKPDIDWLPEKDLN